MEKAVLYNKQTPVLALTMEDGRVLQAGKIYNADMLPMCLTRNDLSSEKINAWLDRRRIPEKRDGLEAAKQRFENLLVYRNMFSLTDQYWIQYNESEKYEDLNYFENHYDEDRGRVFFAPWTVDPKRLEKESPDMTTGGNCRKRWTQVEYQGKRDHYLIKAGSGRFHQEPLSEVLSTMTLEKLNIIDYVRYELVVDGTAICCKSKCFVTADTEFVPAEYIFNKERRNMRESIYDHMVSMCEKLSIPGAADFLNRMIVADYFIGNNDRHLGNFGIIRKAATGEFVSWAPLFDNGSCFVGKKKRKAYFEDVEEQIVIDYIRKNLSFVKELSCNDLVKAVKLYPVGNDEGKQEVIDSIEKRYQEIRVLVAKIESGELE